MAASAGAATPSSKRDRCGWRLRGWDGWRPAVALDQAGDALGRGQRGSRDSGGAPLRGAVPAGHRAGRASELRPVRDGLSALAARFASQATAPRSSISTEPSSAQFKSGSDEAALRGAGHDAGRCGSTLTTVPPPARTNRTASGPAKAFSTLARAVPTERKPETSAAADIMPAKLSSAAQYSGGSRSSGGGKTHGKRGPARR